MGQDVNNPVVSEARRYMEMIERVRDNAPEVMSPYRYILEHGRQYTTQLAPTQKNWRKLYPMKMCYRNAYELALHDLSLTYVEGVAVGVIPTDHAWCVTAEGVVVDPTWAGGRQECNDYYGVSFSLADIQKIQCVTACYGVFGPWWKWEKVFGLLKERKTNASMRNV